MNDQERREAILSRMTAAEARVKELEAENAKLKELQDFYDFRSNTLVELLGIPNAKTIGDIVEAVSKLKHWREEIVAGAKGISLRMDDGRNLELTVDEAEELAKGILAHVKLRRHESHREPSANEVEALAKDVLAQAKLRRHEVK
jgi:hypothetical protein